MHLCTIFFEKFKFLHPVLTKSNSREFTVLLLSIIFYNLLFFFLVNELGCILVSFFFGKKGGLGRVLATAKLNLNSRNFSDSDD